jgi:hypothetical protein
MNPPTPPTAATGTKQARRGSEQLRGLEDLSAQTRDIVLERVRAARKRLAKTSPGAARLR